MRAVLGLLLLAAAPAHASLTEDQLKGAIARPPADARLPAGLAFTDAAGARTTLGAAAGGRPLVLVFADYTCNHLCGPGLALTAGALTDSGLVAGRDYALAVVGLDPKDPPAAAQAMADAQMGPEPAVRRAVRLLRGDPAAVAAATRALGYGYVYDPQSDQFAHDAAVYVFAADGRLAALLPELMLRPDRLRAAITRPPTVQPESLGERVAHLCFGLGAVHGRYGQAAVIALRSAAVLMLLAVAAVAITRRRTV